MEESGLDNTKLFNWLTSPSLLQTMASTIFAAQDKALRTRNFDVSVMGIRSDRRCRVCRFQPETIDHLVSACPVPARTLYITSHNNIVCFVHWSLCRHRRVLGVGPSYFSHDLTSVVYGQDGCSLLWEFGIPTDLPISANRTDIVVVTYKEVLLVDISVPLDDNIDRKVAEKKSSMTHSALSLIAMGGGGGGISS